MLFGLIGRAVIPTEFLTQSAAESVFIVLSKMLLPSFFCGLVVSGIFAAAMSSSSSYLLSEHTGHRARQRCAAPIQRAQHERAEGRAEAGPGVGHDVEDGGVLIHGQEDAFMSIRHSDEIKKSRLIAMIWLVVSMSAAVCIGLIGRAYLPDAFATGR